jgi:hypothetical protein
MDAKVELNPAPGGSGIVAFKSPYSGCHLADE